MKKQHVNARERDRINALKQQRSQWARERVPEVGERSDSMPLPPAPSGTLSLAAVNAKQRNLCRENIARLIVQKDNPRPPVPISLATRLKHLKPVPLAISLLDLTTNTAAAGELPPPKDDNATVPAHTIRLSERTKHRFNRVA